MSSSKSEVLCGEYYSRTASHEEGESSAAPLKIRATKKAAFVSEGRFAFAGIEFICPVSRAESAAWVVCRCGRRSVQTGFLFYL